MSKELDKLIEQLLVEKTSFSYKDLAGTFFAALQMEKLN